MTTERDLNGVVHWISERFGKDIQNLYPGYHFFEDNDPRVQLVTDKWGDQCWLVGYSEGIDLSCSSNGQSHITGNLLVIRVRDWSFQGVHPSSINIRTHYPV
jgi:hypothetical protein